MNIQNLFKRNRTLSPATSTSAQLQTELEAVEKAHAAAVAVVNEADARFIETGEDGDAQAVLDGKKQVDVVAMHLERARKMLQAAKDREAEERRQAELEAKARAQQAHAECLEEDEKLEDEEARLLLEVAKVRAKRWKVRSTARDFATKFVPHDHPDRYHFLEVTRPPYDRVLKTLEASCEGLGGLRGLIGSMQIVAESYNHNQFDNVDWGKLAEQPVKLKACACRPKPQLRELPPPTPKVHEVPRGITLTIAPGMLGATPGRQALGGYIENPQAEHEKKMRLVGAEREAG